MTNENENLDSPNEEEIIAPKEDENQEGEPDLDALKKEKVELSDKNKKLFERAKKSEGEVKELRDKLKGLTEDKPEEENLEKSQPDAPDYSKLAYLEAKGITHSDDQELVLKQAKKWDMNLVEVLADKDLQGKLQTSKEQREAEAGMPKGRGTNSSKTQDDPQYWISKGEMPKDQKTAEQVVESKLAKDDSNRMFDPL